MSRSLNHARHNKDACDHIHACGKFPDWTITTSFYCALHYAYSILFPFKDGNTTYNDIDAYFNDHQQHKNKHQATYYLVVTKYFNMATNFKIIKDAAHTARYHDFEHPPEVVRTIRQKLDKIIEFAEAKYIELHPPTPPTPVT